MNELAPDFLTLGLSTFVYVLIYSTWYSNFFFGERSVRSIKGILFTAFLGIVVTYFLSFFERTFQVTTVSDGMLVALYAWLGFVLTNELIALVYLEKGSRQFFIDCGASLLAYLVIGGIVGA